MESVFNAQMDHNIQEVDIIYYKRKIIAVIDIGKIIDYVVYVCVLIWLKNLLFFHLNVESLY